MALPAGFLDELRARTPLAALVGRRVKLARSGRNWTGCCPFHAERTPSFFVYDDGFHCYGCGAHGDAISFVMQTQGAGFIEAVQSLAAEAGLEVPKPSPEAAAADARRADLHEVLEAAAVWFQRRLHLPEGAAALAYLRGRGLSDETIAGFGLGWSGEGRGALVAELGRQGIAPDRLAEAGLLRAGEPGQTPRELFFSRVMFPIRDARGRAISFGGRTLGEAQPKYLNGPETPAFSKRRTLYALDRARAAARSGADVVVVEGYMDAIALHQAGFAGAVAPLGTALTAEQLDALWRLSPEPVLCFDGDAAGGRATLRAMEAALPLLASDRSLRIATLPSGQDPDSLVRGGGPAAFAGVLQSRRRLDEALFAALREGADTASPEGRAALRTKLMAEAARIPDRALAAEFRSALLDRFFAARPRRGQPKAPAIATVRVHPTPHAAEAERQRCLAAILIQHPALLRDVAEAWGTLDLSGEAARLRSAMLDWFEDADPLDSATLLDHLGSLGLRADVSRTLAATPMPLPGCAAPDAAPAEAEAGWWELFGLSRPDRLDQELAEAGRAFAARAEPQAQRRLIALTIARNALRRGEAGSEGIEAEA